MEKWKVVTALNHYIGYPCGQILCRDDEQVEKTKKRLSDEGFVGITVRYYFKVIEKEKEGVF